MYHSVIRHDHPLGRILLVYRQTSGFSTFGSEFSTPVCVLPNTAEPPVLNFDATAQACTKYQSKCTKS